MFSFKSQLLFEQKRFFAKFSSLFIFQCSLFQLYLQLFSKKIMSQTISFQDLIPILTNSASIACQIIESGSRKFTLKYKEGDDPVTHIDHTIQKSIVSRLENRFPNLSIVGEESLDDSMIDSSRIEIEEKHNNIQFPFENMLQQKRQFETKQLCVFIDPLDCTRGFISNKKWECTVLIGVTYKKRPILGVIGQPYVQTSSTDYIYLPRILVGSSIMKEKCAFEYYGGDINYWSIIENTPKGDDLKRVAISSRRETEKQKKILSSFNSERVSCGGSGNKIAMVIRGQVDATMFIEATTSTWDSCAGQAIILGMGGYFIKPNMSLILYEKENTDQQNREGFICTIQEQLYNKITSVLQY